MSAIENTTALLKRIRFDVPGCPTPILQHKLRDAIRTFASDSKRLKETIELDIVADQAEYTLTLANTTGHILRINEVRLLSDAEVTANMPGHVIDPDGYRLDNSDGAESGIIQKLAFEYGYVPSTAVTDGLIVKVACVPDLFADNVPAWFIDRYSDALCALTRYHLLAMPNREWSSPDSAVLARREYGDRLGDALKGEVSGDKAGSLNTFVPGSCYI